MTLTFGPAIKDKLEIPQAMIMSTVPRQTCIAFQIKKKNNTFISGDSLMIVTPSDVKFLDTAAFSLNIGTSGKPAPVHGTAHPDHLIQSEVDLVCDSTVSLGSHRVKQSYSHHQGYNGEDRKPRPSGPS